MAKTKNKRPGKPRGMNYADMLARRKAINAAKLDTAALMLTEQAMQRALWLTVCSLSDAYGFGKERLDRFFEAYQRNSDELQEMRESVDDDYAFEKLRLRAEQVSGREIKYLHDDLYPRWDPLSAARRARCGAKATEEGGIPCKS